jgi:transcription termination factor Rho
VLDRAALQASPLADLHAIASELSIDGYRRLRREELIDAILVRQDGPAGAAEVADEEDDSPPAPRRRGRRGGRSRAAAAQADEAAQETEEPAAGAEPEARDEREARDEPEAADEPEAVEGVVELLPNGSGFVRVDPPDPSDEDVYISAAQVKRCELVSGDRVAGPRRAPRRSERFASLVRIDTINGRPASELADRARFDELPAAFPSERFRLGSDDPTLKAIEWLTPFGRGSRVSIVGGARAGKTEALRRLAAALSGQDDVQVVLALAGVRPEEISEWARGPLAPTAALSFAASAEAQDHAVELVVDQARRLAARGAHAVVLIDTLDELHPSSARRVIAAARNLVDGGSLTVITTASEPLGGETTVIALDAALASAGRFPAFDLARSGTLRPELLVGDAGAEAIARARLEVMEPG